MMVANWHRSWTLIDVLVSCRCINRFPIIIYEFIVVVIITCAYVILNDIIYVYCND
jgi:hypothetical protein